MEDHQLYVDNLNYEAAVKRNDDEKEICLRRGA